MRTVDLLREGRARIVRGWTRFAYARDANGEDLGIGGMHSQKAVTWCAIGAIYEDWDAMRFLKDAAGIQFPSGLMSPWNDAPGRTKADVLTVYDKAIEMAEAAR